MYYVVGTNVLNLIVKLVLDILKMQWNDEHEKNNIEQVNYQKYCLIDQACISHNM